MSIADETFRPGRSCPLHYRYDAEAFARPADIRAETVYVAGGLYGNRPALAALLEIVDAEPDGAVVVFNGDFHWFDVADNAFLAVNETVLGHVAMRGNVETEIASDEGGAGCGCGYPDSVPDEDVERSNRIIERLRGVSVRFPALRARLAALPMHLVAEIGRTRVGIVHGDAESLAGWSFDPVALDDASCRARIEACFAKSGVDGFASSHTCLPGLRRFESAAGSRWVVNNGAAGMPNFDGTTFGVVSRISTRPAAPGTSLYGLRANGLYVDAVALFYDPVRWQDEFLASWPPGSPAHTSYFRRICRGPAWSLAQATGQTRTDSSPTAHGRHPPAP